MKHDSQLKHNYSTMKNIILHFNSLFEFSKHLSESKLQPNFIGKETSIAKGEYRTEWTGTASYEEADRLMKEGDKASMEQLKKYGFEPDVKKYSFAQRRKITPAVVGFAPIVPNAIAGVPVAMQAVTSTQAKTKVVNVVISTAIDHTVKKENYIQFAAKVLNGCLTLEKRGVRVNLYIGHFSNSKSNSHIENGQNFLALIKIKDSRTAIDPLAVSYPIVNASFNRRHLFRLMETTPGIYKEFAKVHGYPFTYVSDMKKLLPAAIGNALVFAYYDRNNIEWTFNGVK